MSSVEKIRELVQGLNGEEAGFGVVSDDVEARLGAIDDELMKRGTLASADMDAKGIVANCVEILGTCTHLAALRGLVIALPVVEPDKGVEASLVVAEALFASHWPELYPKGKKNARRRNAWANDIVTALEQAVERAYKQNGDLSSSCHAALQTFLEAGKKAGLDLAKLSKLSERPKDTASGEGSQSQADTAPESIRLDARGRADLRHEIRAISERINQFDPKEAVAYYLRGYAAWLEFQFLPDADKDGVTQLQSMPAFVADEFSKVLSSPTPATLAKLEDRLFMSPDWFEGQKMAWDMAARMGMQKIAEAIRSRTQNRLQSFPGLKELKYTNGRQFVTSETEDWLAQGAEKPLDVTSSGQASGAGETNLVALLEAYNSKLENTEAPRSRAILKLDIARAFHTAGLKSQAAMMIGEIRDQMLAQNVDKWDAELFSQVSHGA